MANIWPKISTFGENFHFYQIFIFFVKFRFAKKSNFSQKNFRRICQTIFNFNQGYINHLARCEVRSYREFSNGTRIVLYDSYSILNDGCIDSHTFVQRDFAQKPNRISWANQSEASILFDEFSADLWDMNGNHDNDYTDSYIFICQTELCHIDEFYTKSDNSICKLSPSCENRYDNLKYLSNQRASVAHLRYSKEEQFQIRLKFLKVTFRIYLVV